MAQKCDNGANMVSNQLSAGQLDFRGTKRIQVFDWRERGRFAERKFLEDSAVAETHVAGTLCGRRGKGGKRYGGEFASREQPEIERLVRSHCDRYLDGVVCCGIHFGDERLGLVDVAGRLVSRKERECDHGYLQVDNTCDGLPEGVLIECTQFGYQLG